MPTPENATAEPGLLRSLAKIIRFTSELRGLYVVVTLCAIGAAAAGLVTPFLMGRATDVIVDAVANHKGTAVLGSLVWLAVWILVTEVASDVVSNVGGYSGDVLSNRIRSILSTRYLDKLLRLPQSFFDSELTGAIVARLNRSITEVSNFAKILSNTFSTMLIQAIAVVVISAWFYWPLAVMLVVVFPLYLWLTGLTSKSWQKLEHEKNSHIDTASGRFAEVVSQIRVVRSFLRERRELEHFTEHFERTDETTRAQSKRWHLMDIARTTVLDLAFCAMYLMIFWRTVSGHLTVGQLVLLVQLIAMARVPVTMMSFVVDSSQRAVAGSRDYFAVMDAPETEEHTAQTPSPAPTAPAGTDSTKAAEESERSGAPAAAGTAYVREATPVVAFDQVRFGYGDGPDVLRDITFDIRAGERVALVSESGGGKTTLVNLLLGLYPLRGGHILLDGRDIATMPKDELRRKISIVFQEPSLFSDTVGENIRYGRPDASEEQVAEAALRANAGDFIARLDGGYESLIGERGLKLSGGQKQRVAVARAMLKDARVLVLDEATSSLDTRSERAVQEGLEQLMAGRTSLIIAHRLSTIAGVDRIVTMKDGVVDEIGSPAQLAQTDGVYAELLRLQRRGEDSYLNAYQTTQ